MAPEGWGRPAKVTGQAGEVVPGAISLVARSLALLEQQPHSGLLLQDAEISAFELQTILRRVLARRECPPPP